MKFHPITCLCLCLGILTACGGGSSSNTPQPTATTTPTPDNSWLSFSPSPLQVTTTAGYRTPFTLTATSSKNVSGTFNVAIIDKLGVISGQPQITQTNTSTYEATLNTNSELPAGVYTGTFEVRLCYGDPLKNESPVEGSPWQVPYTITVAPYIQPAGPVVTVTPDQRQVIADGDTTFTFSFDCDMDRSLPSSWDSLIVFDGASIKFVDPATSRDFAWVDARTATFTVHPPENMQNIVFVLPCDSAFRDPLGRPSHGAAFVQKITNTCYPSLSIQSNIANPPASGDVTFTFAFNKPVGDTFTADDIQLRGGTKGAFAWVDPQTATLVASPTPGQGILSVNVPSLVFSDTKNRSNYSSSDASVAYDTTLKTIPTLRIQNSISNPSNSPVATGDILYTFTFSEPVNPTSFDPSDIKLTNATAEALTWKSSTVATLAVSPLTNSHGSLSLQVDAGAFESQLGVSSASEFAAHQDFDTRSGLIINGDFANGTLGWRTETRYNATVDLLASSGDLQATISAIGGYVSDARIINASSLSLIAGKKYRVTFDARSNIYQTIDMEILENGHDLDGDGQSETSHTEARCFLKPTMTSFTHEFTMPITNWDAALAFWVGNKSASTIHIDNVRIVEIP